MKHFAPTTRFALVLLLSCSASFAEVKTATTVAELRASLAAAQPGDTIELAAGTYDVSDGPIQTTRPGSTGAHITISGKEAGATLKWTATSERSCLNIKHSYFVVQNLTIDANGKSKRGILIENASHGKLLNVTVKNSDNEGFKIRKNSQYWLIEDCIATGTGRAGKFGEGFYCGDAKSNWTTGEKPDRTGYITFNRCQAIQTMADGFDCKEGTHHIKIVNCTVDYQNRDVDTKYGNHAVFTRTEGMQVIGLIAKNNGHANASGEVIRASNMTGPDKVVYGGKVEVQGLRVNRWRGGIYWANHASLILYKDFSYTESGGAKQPKSPNVATEKEPASFVQMTWAGEGGALY